MQFRRRWSARAFWASVVACSAATVLAVIPPGLPDPATVATQLKAAHGQDAVDIRTALVDACHRIPSVIDRNDYGAAIASAFEPLLKDPNPDAQLNAAIALGQLHTLSSADALARMLNNPNPAFRYWAAKGLGDIEDLKAVGGAVLDNAVKALNGALAKEKSSIVKVQIMRSLTALADAGSLLDGLDILAGTMLAAAPDQTTLEAASLGLAALDPMINTIKTTPAPDPATAAKNAKALANAPRVVAHLASFACQQGAAMLKSRRDAGGKLPEGYQAYVNAVINNAMRVLTTTSGKTTYAVDTSGSLEETKLNLDGVVGSASLGPGTMQKEFPGVPVPPDIKPPKTAPATATTATHPSGT